MSSATASAFEPTPFVRPNFILPHDIYYVRMQLLTPLLGTVPKDRGVFAAHEKAKAMAGIEQQRKLQARYGVAEPLTPAGMEPATPEVAEARLTEEQNMIPEVGGDTRGWTGFLMEKGRPVLSAHMFRAMLKNVGTTIKQIGPVGQLASKIQRYVFVAERMVKLPPLTKPEDYDEENGGHPLIVTDEQGINLQRPLRAQTPQGPRVTVVKSDVILAGAQFDFHLIVLKGSGLTGRHIRAMLSYAEYCEGLGQWRSSGVFGKATVNVMQQIMPNGTRVDVPAEMAKTGAEAAAEADAEAAAAPKKGRGRPKKAAAAAEGGDGDAAE